MKGVAAAKTCRVVVSGGATDFITKSSIPKGGVVSPISNAPAA